MQDSGIDSDLPLDGGVAGWVPGGAADARGRAGWNRRRLRLVLIGAAALLVAFAAWRLAGIVTKLNPEKLAAALGTISPLRLALAVGATTLSYLALVGYDLSG